MNDTTFYMILLLDEEEENSLSNIVPISICDNMASVYELSEKLNTTQIAVVEITGNELFLFDDTITTKNYKKVNHDGVEISFFDLKEKQHDEEN